MLKCLQLLRLGASTGSSRPWWPVVAAQWRCFSSSDLAKWQRRSQRLEALLRRVRCPRLESFEVDGISYQLPVSAGPPTVEPSREELEYLGGFFDGDGCVSMVKSSGTVRLSVSQSVQRPQILLRFRNALGGGIYSEHTATGASQASLRWIAEGTALRPAASALHSSTVVKKAQLAEALEGNIKAACRDKVAVKLSTLKSHSHQPCDNGFNFTWAYWAGFFDAEGHVSVRPTSVSIVLVVVQKNVVLLRQMLIFMQRKGFHRWRLYEWPTGVNVLKCGHFDTSKALLRKFLARGLSLKRPQAEECLTVTQENHQSVRESLFKMTGNQNRLARLDEAGLQRSKAIHLLQSRKHSLRKGNGRQDGQMSLEAIEAEVSQLQEEHALGNLRSRCSRLRVQLRKLLSEGGVIDPNMSNLRDLPPQRADIKRCGETKMSSESATPTLWLLLS